MKKVIRKDSYKNTILSALSKAEIARLHPYLSPVTLERNKMLLDAGAKMTHAYFLEEGVASIVVSMKNGMTVEVGVVGRDGMAGVPGLLGTDQIPISTFMQVPGKGYRIQVKRLMVEFERPGTLRTKLMRCLQSHLVQASQTAACNRLHEVDQRLARWLLTFRDRVGVDRLDLTHEFLGQMLGTRRSSVTLAAGLLQSRGLIDYSRGRVVIKDRKKLEEASCECYQAIRDEHFRLGVTNSN